MVFSVYTSEDFYSGREMSCWEAGRYWETAAYYMVVCSCPLSISSHFKAYPGA